MTDDTRGKLVDELVDAENPDEVLLTEMKFAAVERHQ